MPKVKTLSRLRYIGRSFIPDIPARDLSIDDIAERAERLGITPEELHTQLVAGGLYEIDQSAESGPS